MRVGLYWAMGTKSWGTWPMEFSSYACEPGDSRFQVLSVLKSHSGGCVVVLVQGTGVWSLVQEICTCCRDWSRNSTTEPACPWVCAPRQKKPSQWEARTRDQRGARPRCTTRESLCAATKTQCSQNNNNNFLKRNKGKKKNQITCQQIMKAQQKIMIQNLSGNNTKWG